MWDSQISEFLIHHAGWGGGQHGQAYPLEFRKRVVASVESGGQSCNQAAK
jgi:hypothetical protein